MLTFSYEARKKSVFKLFTFVPTIPKYIEFCSKCLLMNTTENNNFVALVQ